MSQPGQIAVITDYASLLEAIRTRLDQLNTPHLEFDRSAGLADGHTDKILCGTKNLGPTSLTTILDGAAMMLIAVENPAKIEMARKRLKERETPIRMRAMLRKRVATWLFNKKKARRMGRKRWSNLTPTQRSRVAKKAANARWAKVRKSRKRKPPSKALAPLSLEPLFPGCGGVDALGIRPVQNKLL